MVIVGQILERADAGGDIRRLLSIAARRELHRNRMVETIIDIDHFNRARPNMNPIPIDGPGRELERSAESLGFEWAVILAEARSCAR